VYRLVCLFVCLCGHNQCDLMVCMFINRNLVFNLYVQTKVTLSVCRCIYQGWNSGLCMHKPSAGSVFTMTRNFCAMSHSLELFLFPTLSPVTHLTVTISVCNPDYTACDYLHSEILAIKYDTYIRIILTCSLIHVVPPTEVTV
jgi:hypothetical protein